MGKCFQKRRQLPYQETYNFKEATMSYRVLGKGNPVVLVHGSMYADPWRGFEENLSKSYRVYLPHLPGFGTSDALKGELHNVDLFSEAFCLFLKETNLQKAPVVAFSLGTIVAAKAAAQDCLQGKLILVGAPGQISGWKAKLAQKAPLFLRRILVTTRWGKEKLLLPALRENTGGANKERKEEFLADLLTTDPRAIVDLDYRKEIEEEFPEVRSRLKNETDFVYGSKDQQKGKATLIDQFIVIPEAEHNVFRSQPKRSLILIRKLLNQGAFKQN